MKYNQITLSKLILLFLCLLITGCQTFVSKEETEIIQEPWEKLSLEKKIAQMIMFRLKGDITNETTFEYKKSSEEPTILVVISRLIRDFDRAL